MSEYFKKEGEKMHLLEKRENYLFQLRKYKYKDIEKYEKIEKDYKKFCKKYNFFENKVKNQIIREIYQDLSSQYKVIDYGQDWLKIGFSKINKDFEELFVNTLEKLEKLDWLNSTTGNTLYNYDIFGDKYSIDIYKAPVGLTFKFSKSFSNYGINENVSLFSIAVYQTNNFQLDENYILNIYGITHQFHKIGLYDINENILNNFDKGKTTRIDGNFNFLIDDVEISTIISNLQERFNNSNVKASFFENESVAYGLYESKDKKRLRMTQNLGLRIYNKSKQLYDTKIVDFYPQYKGKQILRFEFVLGSKYLGYILGVDYTTIEELFDLSVNKVLGDVKLSKDVIDNVRKYSYDVLLKRSKNDLQSRIETFIKRGGDLSSLEIDGKPLKDFIF